MDLTVTYNIIRYFSVPPHRYYKSNFSHLPYSIPVLHILIPGHSLNSSFDSFKSSFFFVIKFDLFYDHVLCFQISNLFLQAAGKMNLPTGFRFHPTDEELITHYLAPKLSDSSFSATVISELDTNKIEPWNLPCEF